MKEGIIERMKEIISAVTQVKSVSDFENGVRYTLLAIPISIVFTSVYDIMSGGAWQFIAVLVSVLLDTCFGTLSAIKSGRFAINKAMMVVYKATAYCIILAALLFVEKGFPVMMWISEAILIPIILFQVISALKHAANLKLLTNKQLKNILSKIDKHKDLALEENE